VDGAMFGGKGDIQSGALEDLKRFCAKLGPRCAKGQFFKEFRTLMSEHPYAKIFETFDHSPIA